MFPDTFHHPQRRAVSRINSAPSITALLITCFFLCVIIAVALFASETVVRGVLTSATATAILFPLIVGLANQTFDMFEPIVPATLALLAMFVARPLVDQVTSNYVHLGLNISATFDETLLTVMVGCIALSVGYLSGVGTTFWQLLPRPTSAFPQRSVVEAGVVTAVLGGCLYVVFLASHGGFAMLLLTLKGRSTQLGDIQRHSTGYLYSAINFLVPASFMFFAAWLRSRRFYLFTLTVLAGGPFLLLGLTQGSRIGLLPALLGLGIIYYLHEKRRPKVRNVLILGVLTVGVLAFIRDFRDADSIGRRSLDSMEFTNHPGQSFGNTFGGNDNEMFDTLANTLSVVPDRIPYQPWGLITDLAIRALPRTLYPDKPLEVSDQLIVALWPEHYQRTRASSANSIFGNLYLYGGIVGVALGAFSIGAILNQSWKSYLRNSGNLNAIVLYAFVPGFVVILLRGTITDMFTRMLFFVLPLILAQRYWGGMRPERRRPDGSAAIWPLQ